MKSRVLHPSTKLFRRAFSVQGFDGRTIAVSGVDPSDTSRVVRYRNLFLRDATPELVDVDSHQKNFSTGELAMDIRALKAEALDDKLKVEWSDGHKSTFEKSFLARYANTVQSRNYRSLNMNEIKIWNMPELKDIHNVSFKDYLESDSALLGALERLNQDGLIFVSDIPRPKSDEDIPVEDIARRVGYIQQTFYGQSWNVVSVPNAKNVAYTSVYLPLHMDLLYYESPPGVQLLHVVDNSTEGGESVFADSFAAAYHVLQNDPEAYDALTKVPLTFHYDHPTDHYYFQRPLIVEAAEGKINHETGRHHIEVVNYSPPFQGPLDCLATDQGISDKQVDAFMRGLKMFEAFIEDPENQIEIHTPEGTCMVFMNRRALHGRRQFSAPSGKRFFKGTYLNVDTFYSRLRTLRSKA